MLLLPTPFIQELSGWSTHPKCREPRLCSVFLPGGIQFPQSLPKLQAAGTAEALSTPPVEAVLVYRKKSRFSGPERPDSALLHLSRVEGGCLQ